MAARSNMQPRGSSFEVISWFFMRISGLALLFLAVFHLLYMHLVIQVEKITFNTIVERWSGPLGWFWSLFDMTMLVFALLHGANGARWVIDDYIRKPAWNAGVKAVLYVAIFLLILLGAQTILRFSTSATLAAL